MSSSARPVDTTTAALAGLSSSEAAARLERDGPNELPALEPSPWRLLAAQLVHFFALLLWAAALLALIGGLPQLAVAMARRRPAERPVRVRAGATVRASCRSAPGPPPRRVSVRREGVMLVIDARDLVVDDVVVLEAGDRISADLRCVEAHSLRLDTSTMTGESVPVGVEAGETLHAGTFVTEGEGTALVTAIGHQTRLAGIARMATTERPPPTPLAVELHRVVRTIALIAGSCGIGFFALTYLTDTPPSDGFLFAVGITVALVPSGMLPTLTLSLSIGSQRMAERNALVRHLEAVEALGSTTFICTDKTGTLTMNEMSVVAVWTTAGSLELESAGYDPSGPVPEGDPQAREAAARAASGASLCSTGRVGEEDGRWVAHGDPLEAAIDTLARRLGVHTTAAERAAASRVRFPFDPRRRLMSVVTDGAVLTKGAPDAVLPRCRSVAGAWEALEELTARGLRVLAVARRPITDGVVPSTPEDAEQSLGLTALLGLEDPPRSGAADAIEACRRAGIRAAMVTGDHPATALAIAEEVGLTLREGRAILGEALPADDEELARLVDDDGLVLARVAPEDKLRIARALRGRGHVVAMTGDGVNDAPALHQADIGVAMGRSGTDVAREEADIVLLDDDFSTIVAAIAEGRATFWNLRRFLTYHLTDNVAELAPYLVWALTAGRFPLALSVLQILAIDLGTDTLPAVALGAQPPSPGVLDHPPAAGRLLDRTVATRLRRAGTYRGPHRARRVRRGAPGRGLALHGRRTERLPPRWSLGCAFATVVFGQTATVLACRSTWWALARGLGENPLLRTAIIVEVLAGVGMILVGPVAAVLGHRSPPALGWLLAVVVVPLIIAVDAVHKRARRRVAFDQVGGRTTTTGTLA